MAVNLKKKKVMKEKKKYSQHTPWLNFRIQALDIDPTKYDTIILGGWSRAKETI